MEEFDPRISETIGAYDESALVYENGGFGDASPHVHTFSEALSRGACILEVGCGLGTDAAELTLAGFTVTATDISTGMIKHAKQRYPNLDIDFRDNVSMTDLSQFSDESFDAVIANFSLIHISKEDTPQCFFEFARVLKPGGRLFLGLQEGESQEGFFPAPFDKSKIVFLNIFSPDEVTVLLGQYGFKVAYRQVYPPKSGQHQFNKGVTFARKIS